MYASATLAGRRVITSATTTLFGTLHEKLSGLEAIKIRSVKIIMTDGEFQN